MRRSVGSTGFTVPRRMTVDVSSTRKENEIPNFEMDTTKSTEKSMDDDHRLYQVLIQRKGSKKRKIYDDGFLLQKQGGYSILDANGTVQWRGKIKQSVSPGEIIEIFGKSIEVNVELPYDDYLTGVAFVSTAPKPAQSSKCHGNDISKKFVSPKLLSSGTACKEAKTPASVRSREVEVDYTKNTPSSVIATKISNAENAEICNVASSKKTCVDSFLAQKLREHQKQGVKFMFECVTGHAWEDNRKLRESFFGCILADDMGLGKTLQSITLIWTLLQQGPGGRQHPWVRKAVIVVPATLVGNWESEISKWLGTQRMQPIVVSNQGKVAKSQISEFACTLTRRVMIISYEMARKNADLLGKNTHIDLLICDEGHRLKASEGNRTIDALLRIPTERRVVLTGTPLQNNLSEFFALVQFANPGVLGLRLREFQKIFQTPIETGLDGAASEDERTIARTRSEQLRQLTQRFILRRTADIISKYLPTRNDVCIFIRLGSPQVVRYKQAIKDYFREYYSSNSCSADALKLVQTLRQICVNPIDGTSGTTMSSKMQFLGCFLEEMWSLNPHDKIVIVSSSTKTLDLVEEMCKLKCVTWYRLDGSTPANARQNLVDQFNMPIRCFDSIPGMGATIPRIFLLSAKAGGCGLNLIGANRLILLEPDWNPAVDAQATARIWRDKQTKEVFIYRLLSTGTIEERIYERQVMKNAMGDGLACKTATKEKDIISGKFTKDDLKNLFHLDEYTSCLTYDLLQKFQLQSGTSCGKSWPRYTSSDIVSDPVGQNTIAKMGSDVVTWVHIESINSEPGPPSVEVIDDDDPPAEYEPLFDHLNDLSDDSSVDM